MSVFELARKYYPRLWGLDRLNALMEAGKLTAAEFEEITGNPYEEVQNETH